MDTGRKLGERITDTSFWRNEVNSELQRLIIENGKMQDCRRNLRQTIQNLEGQLHIAQECLYYRESRTGSWVSHYVNDIICLLLIDIYNSLISNSIYLKYQ